MTAYSEGKCILTIRKENEQMKNYNPESRKAEEFINDGEILETIRYAEENSRNIPLIDSILEKARPRMTEGGLHCAGLTHREASVLLACDIPEKVEEMYRLAEQIKAGVLWKPHCDVCAALSLELLCQRMCLLSLSSQEQTYPENQAVTGRHPA